MAIADKHYKDNDLKDKISLLLLSEPFIFAFVQTFMCCVVEQFFGGANENLTFSKKNRTTPLQSYLKPTTSPERRQHAANKF